VVGSNYVWFEFGLHMLAKRLWSTAGAAGLQAVITALRGIQPSISPKWWTLLAELDPSVAQAIQNWPNQK
jgi:hypothetical protein